MDDLKDDNACGDVDTLITFFSQLFNQKHDLTRLEKGESRPRSLSIKSDQSIENPLLLKGRHVDTPVSEEAKESSLIFPLDFKKEKLEKGESLPRSLSIKSDQSIENPLLLKGRHVYTPVSEEAKESSLIFPLDFKREQFSLKKVLHIFSVDTPDSTSSVCEAKESSLIFPLDFKIEKLEKGESRPRSLSIKSDQSIENPLLLKGRHVDTSVSEEAKDSSLIFPLDFKREKWTTPNDDYLSYRSKSPLSICLDGGGTVPCDVCGEKTAMKTCLTCNVSYCEKHFRPHYKVKALLRHKFTDVSYEVERKRCQHDRSLKYFCRTDHMQICRTCVKGIHHGHDIISQNTEYAPSQASDGDEVEGKCTQHYRSLKYFCRTDHMQICKTCVKGIHQGHDIILQKTEYAPSQVSGGDDYQNPETGMPPPGVTPPKVPPPGEIKFHSVEQNSVVLSWECPKGLKKRSKSFRVEWSASSEKWCSSTKVDDYLVIKDVCTVTISKLKPGQMYQFSVTTEDKDSNLSERVTASVFTVMPPPGKIKFLSLEPNSVVLSWECPKGLTGPMSFRVEWSTSREKWSSSTKVEDYTVIKDVCTVTISKLKPGQKYQFSVTTVDEDGNSSERVTASVSTVVPAPQNLTAESSEGTNVSLKWSKGENMEEIPHKFLITVERPGEEPLPMYTENCHKIVSDLQPDTKYKFYVSTVLNDQYSEAVSETIQTESRLRDLLSKIGIQDQYDKLTLSTVLEINQNDTSENKFETSMSLSEAFLKKLMMLNANARNVRRVPCDEDTDKNKAVNPLDLITALILCSDSFLQQTIVSKMALCQFAVPLLLPNCETKEVALMLWSMREIVRKVTPSNQARLRCEERIVFSNIPLVSFVRLGKAILSKSQILNKLFSNTQQYHDTFHHRNMVCGDVSRKISNGLVEISWYLPCGKSTDKFSEPLAVANLRGDIQTFDKQFKFLCQTSAAIYIFCDESETAYLNHLESKDVRGNVILISSFQGKNFTLKMMTMEPQLKITDLTQKKKTDAEVTKALQESILSMLENCPSKVSVENLVDAACMYEFLVDEDSDECKTARKNANAITKHVRNTSEFKEKQLIYQGHIWKVISWLETECWRLRKVGNRNADDYRGYLLRKEKSHRRRQQKYEMTAAILSFFHGISSEVQRYYFLKWLEMDLDNLSREELSVLNDEYKEQSQSFPQDCEKIADIDKQISACSLRLDHFFRECGQLYECVDCLPEHSYQRKNIQQLPELCAQLLLDGFPLELVDGDVANIPMKWITEVLTQLHYILKSSSKLKVITIIGAENSGKSTLLNTMFGVRFAVSNGRCTRGAFIQVITVNKDISEELGCDCIIIIDTEGLKLQQLVQDDHSHERDEEVASLAVALSDATIVSISKNNSSDEDILEKVLHAFTRLKDVGTKPLCHFVYSNMSDMERTGGRRTGQDLMEELNQMIQKDIRMKKANITKISDVMEFDPDTFSRDIPPLWDGTPPMAHFSVEYSETAHALKKQLIADLKKCKESCDLTCFTRRVESLWKALRNEATGN